MTKFCVKCKYCLPSEARPLDPEYSRCGFEHPISYVTGLPKAVLDLPFCSGERALHGRCSPLANNWEAADHVMTEEEEKELMEGDIRHE
jgi:hypothetical protein